MKYFVFFSMIFVPLQSVLAQQGYPVPPKNAALLFYIQHSDNHNTYVYEAVRKGKLLDETTPVEAHRKMYANKGEKEPLTALQRTMAYGVKSKKLGTNFFEIKIVSFKQLPFYLKLNAKNKPVVYTTVNNKKMYIDHIFLQIKSGSGLSIQPEYAIFTGRHFTTGALLKERFAFD